MAKKTAAELKAYIFANVKPNDNNEITAQIEQTLFIDFVDSFLITDSTIEGVFNFSQTSTGVEPIAGNTQIPFLAAPKAAISVAVNGQFLELGYTVDSSFYAKSEVGDLRTNIGNIIATDILYYNATTLGYNIDSSDKLVLRYIVEI